MKIVENTQKNGFFRKKYFKIFKIFHHFCRMIKIQETY